MSQCTCLTYTAPSWKFCPLCGTELHLSAQAEEPIVQWELNRLTHGAGRVAVGFVDLVASTRLARALQSDEYFALMREVLAVLAHEVNIYRGRVLQFQGDAVLGVFGVERILEGDLDDVRADAVRAVQSARAALEAIRAYGRTVGIKLLGRAGVAVGKATAGFVGNDLTLFGDVVNLARRLCSAARTGEIWLSDEAHVHTSAFIDDEYLPDLVLRDFPEESPYRVLGVKPVVAFETF